MANRYVYSGAGGAGTGADWANAFTTLALACAADSAGDVFFVAHDHAESTAGNIAPAFAGTALSPSIIYCVDRGGSVPPVAADLRTTGSVATSGGTSTITLNGSIYCYGLNFTAGSGASGGGFVVSNTVDDQHWDNCTFTFGTTGTVTFQTGSTTNNSRFHARNCTFTCAATGQTFSLFGDTQFYNCTINGSAIPTTVFTVQVHCPKLILEGCDLSAIGSGKTLFAANRTPILMKDCKLGASVTLMATGSTVPVPVTLNMVNCDSGDTNYRTEKHAREGDLTTEITVVRTGGASDGTTPIAWKIITSAESEIAQPFEAPPIAKWNETTGSAVTATVEGTWPGGAVPDSNDLWIEVQYLGTSGFPMSSKVTSGVATPLHTASAYSASSAVWGGGTSDFSMSATFTPQEKGLFYVYTKAALASSTFYIDPKVTVS